MEKTKIIELDCDGVLTDIGTAIYESEYGKKMREYNLTFDDSVTFDFENFPDSVRRSIFEAFGEPAITDALKLYNGADEFLIKLSKLISERDGYHVILRSGALPDCEKNKHVVLEKILNELNIDNFQIVIVPTNHDKGYGKDSIDSYIYVEDSPQNIIESDAEHKIIFNRSYNHQRRYPCLGKVAHTRVYNYDALYHHIASLIDAAL